MQSAIHEGYEFQDYFTVCIILQMMLCQKDAEIIAIFKIKAHSHKNGTNPSNQRSLQHKKPSEWLQADHPKTGL